MVEFITEGTAAVSLDDRYFPVVIATWSGPANPTTVRGFFDWFTRTAQRALDEGVRTVQISDATAAGRPDPVTRKLFAELTNAQSEELTRVSLATIVVLDNPILRGAMTAIGWLTRIKLEQSTITVADMPSAIRRARDMLTAAGQRPPTDLDPHRYLPPKVASSAS